jgi:MFS transporter, PPP family, 3-phenylpropionic acid transporter
LSDVAPRDASATVFAGYYFAWFAAIGAFGPFLASFLESRGLSARGAAWVLAALPLARGLVTPMWTYAADRMRSPGRVLQLVAAGAALSFAALVVVKTPAAVVAIVALYTVFRAPSGPLADSLVLAWSKRTSKPFGRVRAWGSVGYLVAAFGAGTLLERAGPETAVTLTLMLLTAAALCAFAVPAAPPRKSPPLWGAFRRVASDLVVLRVLVAGVLTQMGQAPYDMLFPTWFARRAGGTWAGASIALGVACEIVVMLYSRPWLSRLGPSRVMALSCAAGALRWVLVARASSDVVIGLAQLLHAFSFGTFFLASVESLDRAAPPEVRASVQGVQHTVVYSGGSALGLGLAGALGGVVAMREVFAVAALCAVVSTGLMLIPLRGDESSRAGAP